MLILKIFYLTFTLVGGIFFCAGTVMMFSNFDDKIIIAPIFMAMGFILVLIGFMVARNQIKRERKIKRILKNPERVIRNAKVVG